MTLLEQARELNATIEKNYLGLALALYEIKKTDAWKDEYESFADFYKNDLGRERSTVSRLLTVGEWVQTHLDGMLPAGNIGYKKLAASINAFPDKDPKYILSAAQTLTDDDLKAEKKEACPGHDLDLTRQSAPCRHCGMWIKV